MTRNRVGFLSTRFDAAAAFCGILLLLAAPPLSLSYLAWVCLVPLVWAFDVGQASPAVAFRLAAFTGVVTHLGTLSWVVAFLRDGAYLPLPVAFAGYVGFVLAQGAWFGLGGLLTQLAHRRLGVPLVFAAPTAFTLVEWSNPLLYRTQLASTQVTQVMLIQAVEFWGTLGLSFLVVLANVVIYDLAAFVVGRGHRLHAAATLACVMLVASSLVYGRVAISDIDDTVDHAGRELRVGLVQPNLAPRSGSDNPREGLVRHHEQSLEVIRQGAEVVIWPESSYQYPITSDARTVASSVLGPLDKPLLFGGLRLETDALERVPCGPRQACGGTSRLFNSAFLVDGRGTVFGACDKTLLLPFREYVPLGNLLPSLYELVPFLAHLSAGSPGRPLALDGGRYGVLLGLDDMVPSLARALVGDGAELLVSLANDAPFGKNREPLLHLALARLRAVEHRRFLVRASNSGVSAVIDPAGRIVRQAPAFARANVVADVALLSGKTFYAHAGNWPAALCLLAWLVWLRHHLWRAVRRLVHRS